LAGEVVGQKRGDMNKFVRCLLALRVVRDQGSGIRDQGLWIVDCGLWIVDEEGLTAKAPRGEVFWIFVLGPEVGWSSSFLSVFSAFFVV
jgi:hypothetical protein